MTPAETQESGREAERFEVASLVEELLNTWNVFSFKGGDMQAREIASALALLASDNLTLRAALRKVEWATYAPDDEAWTTTFCPACGSQHQGHGHEPGCTTQAALGSRP